MKRERYKNRGTPEIIVEALHFLPTNNDPVGMLVEGYALHRNEQEQPFLYVRGGSEPNLSIDTCTPGCWLVWYEGYVNPQVQSDEEFNKFFYANPLD